MISVDGQINKSVNQGRGGGRVAKELLPRGYIHILASEGGHGITVEWTDLALRGPYVNWLCNHKALQL